MNDHPKISAVMCTYGRFQTVRQSATFWKYQDYDNKELIIFNTSPIPIELDDSLLEYDIRVVNQQTETDTVEPFSSLGKIREDALEYATGDIYICWDDDDMFLPWHMSQGVEKLLECGDPAWMPGQSYWSCDGGETFEHAQNAMEAAVLVDIDELKKYGFSHESGAEHLPWRRGMQNDGKLDEQVMVTPYESYAYVWGSADAPHKTSGNINQPNNFEHHKAGSTDFGEGEKLTFVPNDQVEKLFINVCKSMSNDELYEKVGTYLTRI
tara:strand:- start:293 stop:1093 length:801 start_codon:yes stop_codon:yes gene_type:complete